MSERDDARRATAVMYGRRFEGMPKGAPDYTGEFPCQMVAEKTPITTSPEQASHDRCWAVLFSNFDKAWDAFHMEPS